VVLIKYVGLMKYVGLINYVELDKHVELIWYVVHLFKFGKKKQLNGKECESRTCFFR